MDDDTEEPHVARCALHDRPPERRAPRPSGDGIAVTVTVTAEFNMADALELITKLIAALHRSHYPGDGT